MKKRIFSLFLIALLFFLFASKFLPYIERVFYDVIIFDKIEDNLVRMVGFLYMIIYVVLVIAGNYQKTLNYFLIENEKLKQEKILSDYKALQDQLNPHFLFNNLSTLIAIIHTDKDKAVDFAENFTDVYRYVLTKEGQVAVTVEDELNFLNSYTTLHMARIGHGLKVDIDVKEPYTRKKVPHLSLQILVENAIKHNITSKTKPLIIRIGINEGKLYVANNKQLKQSTYSTKTGLSNLSKRLKILTDEELRVIEDESTYRVEIPLID
ncbi:sensor histidine kinase [Plebeiibacterium marinum]|uniref:Histidine kinase n=1 Tax=Plebeiibacterium marinum TaxID=2992111 RepID=A0AAE3MHR3_9BACT|nr:histidine kinase [Plebeiobacterium marinum]MCW3807949.1 histidine kinase [Plebeiobacterium marinum]